MIIISYEPLWNTLKQKNISQYSLIKEYGFSTGTLDALRKNRSITLNTLHDICRMLDCEITDVVEFTKDETDDNGQSK
ncbi:helix-turn-helix transcriptional regulator [Blautia pseudococcoides]|uniref:helix-turn-helix domain-containing protein n=1 Tax=Blautia pseudococcoides TaxID=1796616 RepID=UPI001FAE27F6|nr:helix-turn-helix transcriptional regulator [Blautia pseudococcoides]